MSRIHPTAIIDPGAEIGENVEIGPYCIIGPHCTIGDNTQLAPHVVLESHTRLGRNCRVGSGAVLGGLPQDLGYKGEESWAIVGNNVWIRECVTINRASGEGKVTVAEDDSMLMAYSHMGHNSHLGKKAILANSVQLGGYVEVGDSAFIGGGSVMHQFIRIGRLAMISGFSASRQDLPPFSMSASCPALIRGVNRVGLKRAGFDREERLRIKRAFHLLWFSNLSIPDGLSAIRDQIEPDPNIDELIQFVTSSKRGIHRPDAKFLKDTSSERFADPEPLNEVSLETV